jgi:hypothetical protein
VLLVLALASSGAGAGLLLAGAQGSIYGSSSSGSAALLQEASPGVSEVCSIVHGLEGELHEENISGTVSWTGSDGERVFVELTPAFDPALPAVQLELASGCDALLASETSPLNSAADPNSVQCLMHELRKFATTSASLRTHRPFPLNQTDVLPVIEEMLCIHPHLRPLIGYTDSRRTRIAWLRTFAPSKYEVRSGQMLGMPDAMSEYIDSWTSWVQNVHSGSHFPALQQSWPSCRSWEVYPTLLVFLDGVTRSLILTPLFCFVAIFAIVRDVLITFAALYAIAGTIVVTLGGLQLSGVPLGPIESLALAVIIGVSVDYLVHLAFAYRNSLMQ